jgi:hypothetical protein
MSQLIKSSAPQTQKVHIELAKREIESGLRNFNDALLNIVAKNNFTWDKKDIEEHKAFIGRVMRKFEGLYNYFNLPE